MPRTTRRRVDAIRDREMLLKRLKNWLGWDSESGLPSLSDLDARPRAQPPPKPPTVTQTRAAEPQRRAKPERTPRDVLDNPRLTLDKPADDGGFDPYNTGAFNRSTSWERIGRQRKR